MSNRLQLTQLAASIALVAGSAAFVSSAHAAAPAAGTNISNVASATYTDSTGASKSVNSNIVTTTVSPVGSIALVANRTATANPNALVSLSHTLTNNGNSSDTITLSVANNAGDDYDFSGLKVYLDTNNDGTPDGAPIVIGNATGTITLAAGQSVNLIVEGTTNATAAVGNTGQWTLNAVSGRTDVVTGGALTASNIDTVTIINGAVISLTKSASVSLIDATKATPADREVTYTLVYKNTGNSVATNVLVTDVLDAKLEYVTGSAKLMGVGQTDDDNAAVDEYKFVGNTLTLKIPSLAPNTTGTLTFKARVVQNTDPTLIKNTAEVDPGTGTKTPSNDNYVEVAKIFKGTINDSDSNNYADGANPGAPLDNQITIANLLQGQVAVFGTAATEKIVIHNTGNFADEFNVSATNINLPNGAGTGIVALYQADGVTPFVSTGTLAKDGKYELVAKITLPATYSGNTALTATLLVKPKSNPAQTADTLDLVISKVTPATVDLHNGTGADQDGSGAAVGSGKDANKYANEASVLPGNSVTFPLQVDNLGSVSDNFNLSHNLPAGWDVKFYIADAAGTGPTGSPITNTGNLDALTGTKKLVAVITPPLGETADDKEVLLTVTSPATGLSDTIAEKLTVKADRKLVLNQDRIGQVAPGGTVVYKHTLTNNSNLVEGATAAGIPFTLTSLNTDWAASLYIDNNNDGLIDANDTLVTGTALTFSGNAGIVKGATVNLLVKVQAPVNATVGTQNPVVLTFNPVDYNGISHAALKNTDLTTVTEGQVRLVKDQYLANCTTGAALSGTYTQATVSAKPGQCVKYRIVATNEGNATVTSVVISDNTPSYTQLNVTSGEAGTDVTATGATLQNPATYTNGYKGTVSAAQASFAPNATASLEFVIKVDE